MTIKVRINQEFGDETRMSSNKPFMFFKKLGLAKGSWAPFFIWDDHVLAGPKGLCGDVMELVNPP